MAWLNSKTQRTITPQIEIVFLIWTFNAPFARSETFELSTGLDKTQVVSSAYQSPQISVMHIQATYTRPILGRWSILGQYHMNLKNSFTYGVVGVTYDSEDFVSRGGAIALDGTAEVTKNPIWVYRGSFGLGLFKYVDTLKSNDPSLGSRNLVPIQADLYGLKFSVSIIRFLSERWGISTEASYSAASAQNFGISNTSISFGSIFRN
ncbi:MAG: hypothetical protein NT027_09755 [Proteobacteria bacterium]|nr:hypothetical protein [Pseudomonadota bacterium]